MILQFLNGPFHAVFLPKALDDHLVGRADEREDYQEANRRQQERIRQTRRRTHGNNVAIAHRGHRHQHEVKASQQIGTLPRMRIHQPALRGATISTRTISTANTTPKRNAKPRTLGALTGV